VVTYIKPTQNELFDSSWLKILITVRIPSIFWAERSKSPQAGLLQKKTAGNSHPRRFFFPDFVWLETLKLVAQCELHHA
jgi:hypothetical protein